VLIQINHMRTSLLYVLKGIEGIKSYTAQHLGLIFCLLDLVILMPVAAAKGAGRKKLHIYDDS